MIEYNVVRTTEVTELEYLVKLRLNEGWSCVGGVCVVHHKRAAQQYFYQAIQRGSAT
jgi:hypothetical protein